MATYNYIHDDMLRTPVGIISPGAFDDSLMDHMFDMSPYANQQCNFDGTAAGQFGMMTPGAFGHGIAGIDASMQHYGQEPFASPIDALNGFGGMPAAMNYGSPPPAAQFSHLSHASMDSRSNSIAAMSHGSSFANSAGFTSPSSSMSRRSSIAPSVSGFVDGTAAPNQMMPAVAPPVTEGWEPEDVHFMGYRDHNGEWRCKHEGCTSKKTFTRACDLRKHFRLHEKSFFCSKPDCPWSRIGFSLRKDCKRHEASHKPEIECPAEGCDRTFSRSDNMKEHYKKIHQRAQNNTFPRPCRKRTVSRS